MVVMREMGLMRICLVTTSYPRFEQDGNARFVRSIAEAQAARGHEVHVLAPYRVEVRPYDSPVHLHWFRYVLPARLGVMGHAHALENDRHIRFSVWLQSPLFALSLMTALQRIIKRWQIDLVHAHWVVPAGFLSSWVALANGRPLFISLHGSDMYVARRNRLARGMAAWAFRHARGVTACSPEMAQAAIECGVSPQAVRVVPYGADPKQFEVQAAPKHIRRQLGLAPDDLVILAAGRLVAKKGFDQLVRAMSGVVAAVPKAHLVIVGEGPERARLKQLTKDCGLEGKLLLLGQVPWTEMPAYLMEADVFAMPSVRDTTGNLDGLPNVILEAMAAGRPVVATRLGGIPLAVQDNVTGLLVNEANSDELCRALVHLLLSKEKRQAMGQAGRARVQTEMNWRRVAERLDQMYQPVK
jgi:glycosyltransferase involved in cell wall biosynthesis